MQIKLFDPHPGKIKAKTVYMIWVRILKKGPGIHYPEAKFSKEGMPFVGKAPLPLAHKAALPGQSAEVLSGALEALTMTTSSFQCSEPGTAGLKRYSRSFLVLRVFLFAFLPPFRARPP